MKTRTLKNNGGEDKLFRMALIMEGIGEICKNITKNEGDFAEEHADLMILLLGNCVAYDVDILSSVNNKLDKLENLEVVSVDGHGRLVTKKIS